MSRLVPHTLLSKLNGDLAHRHYLNFVSFLPPAVRYLGSLEALVSCSTRPQSSMVIGWREKESRSLRVTSFFTKRGVWDIDHHRELNLIGRRGRALIKFTQSSVQLLEEVQLSLWKQFLQSFSVTHERTFCFWKRLFLWCHHGSWSMIHTNDWKDISVSAIFLYNQSLVSLKIFKFNQRVLHSQQHITLDFTKTKLKGKTNAATRLFCALIDT